MIASTIKLNNKMLQQIATLQRLQQGKQKITNVHGRGALEKMHPFSLSKKAKYPLLWSVSEIWITLTTKTVVKTTTRTLQCNVVTTAGNTNCC